MKVRELIEMLLTENMEAEITVGFGEDDFALSDSVDRDRQRGTWVQLKVEEA